MAHSFESESGNGRYHLVETDPEGAPNEKHIYDIHLEYTPWKQLILTAGEVSNHLRTADENSRLISILEGKGITEEVLYKITLPTEKHPTIRFDWEKMVCGMLEGKKRKASKNPIKP
jgi:hypothetical protein